MRDVTFEYLVNGQRLMPEYMTSTSLDLVFGSNDYAITGYGNMSCRVLKGGYKIGKIHI